MAISELLLDDVKSQYEKRRLHRYFTLEVLDKRIDTCSQCVHVGEVNCSLLGCSVFRFKEMLLSAMPGCPIHLHKE